MAIDVIVSTVQYSTTVGLSPTIYCFPWLLFLRFNGIIIVYYYYLFNYVVSTALAFVLNCLVAWHGDYCKCTV